MSPPADTAIHAKLRSVIDKLLFMDKRNVFQFRGIKLFASEIHLILLVSHGGEQARNATRIAQYFGVTKGAVSQTVSRLERKGIITKVKDPAMKNELCLAFTKTGERVVEELLDLEHEAQRRHESALRGFSPREREVILRFLTKLDGVLAQSGAD